MHREEALKRLAAQRARLKDFKVKSLAIFGSVARDEARTDSDVDVLVEFDGPATFDGYISLKEFLEQILGTRVDLTTKKGIRPELRAYVEKDSVNVT